MSMGIPVRRAIIVMRMSALIVLIASVGALWNLMSWLPWQIDGLIAAAAALAFAYRYEREDQA
jgi:hypothetical protein